MADNGDQSDQQAQAQTTKRRRAAKTPPAAPTLGEQFWKETSGPYAISGLYFLCALDPVIECAARVADDFFKRPHLYTSIGVTDSQGRNEQLEWLAAIHARYGHHEHLMDQRQRQEIYRGHFGGLDATGGGDFSRLKEALLIACTAFAERVYDTGVDMLRERVVAAHRPFKEYLSGLAGSSLSWSRAHIGILARDAYTVLQDPGISAVFGVATPPVAEWPYVEDSNADKLVEQIDRQLPRRATETAGDDGRRGGGQALSREGMTSIQRVGLRGVDALQAVIDYDESGSGDQDALIGLCYTWNSALLWLPGSRPAAGHHTHGSSGEPEAGPAEVGVADNGSPFVSALRSSP